MKRRASSVLLSLLLLLTLVGCGEDVVMNQGSHSAVIQGQYGASDSIADLPVQEPDVNQDDFSDDSQGNLPEDGWGEESEGNKSSFDGENENVNPSGEKGDEGNQSVDEDGWYTSKEEVALYIHLYGDLPDNYVTKQEAEQAGWSGGNVERYTGEGTAIGGSYFGNHEGLLPKERGRTYTECDIDTPGKNSRGAKRIVYSNDGLVYYTDDHYESFELLYGEP